jgi:ATP-binding protein involved in chromosome partitioning
MNINYLAEIPLVQSIREAGDIGRPAVLQEDTPQANVFMQLVESTVKLIEK